MKDEEEVRKKVIRYRFNFDAIPSSQPELVDILNAFISFVAAFNLIITPEKYFHLSDKLKKYWTAFEKEDR